MSNSLPRDVSDALFDIVDGLANNDLTRMDALCEIKDVIEDYIENYCELEKKYESAKQEILCQQEEIERLEKLNSRSLQNDWD